MPAMARFIAIVGVVAMLAAEAVLFVLERAGRGPRTGSSVPTAVRIVDAVIIVGLLARSAAGHERRR
jgi:hypothetical protein